MALAPLHYFKFIPGDYLTGTIQFCSLAAKGLFTDICAFYWQRECEMTKSELERKYPQQDLLQELYNDDIIKFDLEYVTIQFLCDQMDEIKQQSKRNSINGGKGAAARTANAEAKKMELEQIIPVPVISATNQTNPAPVVKHNPHDAQFFYIGKETFKTKVSVYVQNELQIHIQGFMHTVKPITIDQILIQMDSVYPTGSVFSNHAHVIRSFNKIARELQQGKPVFNKYNQSQEHVKAKGNYGAK